ncbi:SHOCT domain-containing protein [Agromyces sp. NPDC057679]|uniref:SHOCT domain-containing protein n=1 Tax=Agromyces sp. NPDC057679 TaxID=3346207 RepID=UPI00366F3125
MSTLIYSFTSHILGKNARVRVYDTHVEWEKPRGVSGGKITAGILTGGVSLLATGVKNGKHETEMIPIKNITSIVTKRDGMMNSKVQVITAGNTLDMRVSHAEAAKVKDVVQRLMHGEHVDPINPESFSSTGDTPAVQPAPAAAGPAQQLPTPAAPALAAPPAPAAAPAAPQQDVMSALQQLGALRDAGILTPEEFETKKTELLSRI